MLMAKSAALIRRTGTGRTDTVNSAPKLRALQRIADLEGTTRGRAV